MKVTLVSICPTDAARAAGAPALTPELLAATGARYSRNNEGLTEILAKIDPANLDKSVDGIFRMIDYGHQSIADMAPVAMFLDGVSQWLAFWVWNLCPTAGGQESSTRYIEMGPSLLRDAADLGIPGALQAEWRARMDASFAAYQEASAQWQALADATPALMRLPAALVADPDEKAQKKVARLRRNYAFDRARYFLPFAGATNLMLMMSARGWVQLCQQLGSHALPEARALGTAIHGQLALATPRLMKHAVEKDSIRRGQADWFETVRQRAARGTPAFLRPDTAESDHPARVQLDVMLPPGVDGAALASDLRLHDNRYAWIGHHLRRTAVRVAWEAMTLAEIRDLNRHRTGTRTCTLEPVGFYAALDEIPAGAAAAATSLRRLNETGRALTARAHALLAAGDPSYVYWLPMGAECPFEHVTTADKFLYEAELRTGQGAHYRYARHLHDALVPWYARFPETRGLVLEGTAEPE
jgi:thymidylate synthase ThyX